MNTGERVKQLRKDLKLSQAKLGERLGVSRDVINNIEQNRLSRPEQKEPLFKLICKEFKINYLWLIEGIGESKIETPEDIFDEVQAEFDLSNDDIGLLKEICELDEDERKELKKYIRSLIKAKREEG